MTTAHAHRRATFADLEHVPGNMVGEILNGELVVSPRPAPRHAQVVTALAGELSGPFQRGRGGPGGWWILFEPELHLGEDAVVPDLAGWRKERLPQLPSEAAFTSPPDWVCEVLSPSTARTDLVDKKPLYARQGVRHLWLVDPALKTLQVYRLVDGSWVDVGGYAADMTVHAEPFDALELDLSALWGGFAP